MSHGLSKNPQHNHLLSLHFSISFSLSLSLSISCLLSFFLVEAVVFCKNFKKILVYALPGSSQIELHQSKKRKLMYSIHSLCLCIHILKIYRLDDKKRPGERIGLRGSQGSKLSGAGEAAGSLDKQETMEALKKADGQQVVADGWMAVR